MITKTTKHRMYKRKLSNKNPEVLFFNGCFDKNRIKMLIAWSLKNCGQHMTIGLLENLKNMGFSYATKAGISIGIHDLELNLTKQKAIKSAKLNIQYQQINYEKQYLNKLEKLQYEIDTWQKISENLKESALLYFKITNVCNPVYMMALSGARGNMSQVRQLIGIRGLMSDLEGQVMSFAIKSNFRDGITITEYLISCYGSRKGVVDTSLRTANSGYLTRRLVDVCHHMVVSEFNCPTKKGICMRSIIENNKITVPLQTKLVGRVLAKNIHCNTIINNKQIFRSKNTVLLGNSQLKVHFYEKTAVSKNGYMFPFVKISLFYYVIVKKNVQKYGTYYLFDYLIKSFTKLSKKQKHFYFTFKKTDVSRNIRYLYQFLKYINIYFETYKIIAYKNQEVNKSLAEKICNLVKKKAVWVRSPLTCCVPNSLCQLCYGWSLFSGKLVTLGEVVGIIAAQSIGEPGTQLTMRTFHTGGVFSGQLVDEISAPVAGKIVFSSFLLGKLIRTSHGKIAFLTKIEASLEIQQTKNINYDKKLENQNKIPVINQTNKNQFSLIKKKKSNSYFLKIPAGTILLVRNHQLVKINESIAQLGNQNKDFVFTPYPIQSEVGGELEIENPVINFGNPSIDYVNYTENLLLPYPMTKTNTMSKAGYIRIFSSTIIHQWQPSLCFTPNNEIKPFASPFEISKSFVSSNINRLFITPGDLLHQTAITHVNNKNKLDWPFFKGTISLIPSNFQQNGKIVSSKHKPLNSDKIQIKNNKLKIQNVNKYSNINSQTNTSQGKMIYGFMCSPILASEYNFETQIFFFNIFNTPKCIFSLNNLMIRHDRFYSKSFALPVFTSSTNIFYSHQNKKNETLVFTSLPKQYKTKTSGNIIYDKFYLNEKLCFGTLFWLPEQTFSMLEAKLPDFVSIADKMFYAKRKNSFDKGKIIKKKKFINKNQYISFYYNSIGKFFSICFGVNGYTQFFSKSIYSKQNKYLKTKNIHLNRISKKKKLQTITHFVNYNFHQATFNLNPYIFCFRLINKNLIKQKIFVNSKINLPCTQKLPITNYYYTQNTEKKNIGFLTKQRVVMLYAQFPWKHFKYCNKKPNIKFKYYFKYTKIKKKCFNQNLLVNQNYLQNQNINCLTQKYANEKQVLITKTSISNIDVKNIYGLYQYFLQKNIFCKIKKKTKTPVIPKLLKKRLYKKTKFLQKKNFTNGWIFFTHSSNNFIYKHDHIIKPGFSEIGLDKFSIYFKYIKINTLNIQNKNYLYKKLYNISNILIFTNIYTKFIKINKNSIKIDYKKIFCSLYAKKNNNKRITGFNSAQTNGQESYKQNLSKTKTILTQNVKHSYNNHQEAKPPDFASKTYNNFFTKKQFKNWFLLKTWCSIFFNNKFIKKNIINNNRKIKQNKLHLVYEIFLLQNNIYNIHNYYNININSMHERLFLKKIYFLKNQNFNTCSQILNIVKQKKKTFKKHRHILHLCTNLDVKKQCFKIIYFCAYKNLSLCLHHLPVFMLTSLNENFSLLPENLVNTYMKNTQRISYNQQNPLNTIFLFKKVSLVEKLFVVIYKTNEFSFNNVSQYKKLIYKQNNMVSIPDSSKFKNYKSNLYILKSNNKQYSSMLKNNIPKQDLPTCHRLIAPERLWNILLVFPMISPDLVVRCDFKLQNLNSIFFFQNSYVFKYHINFVLLPPYRFNKTQLFCSYKKSIFHYNQTQTSTSIGIKHLNYLKIKNLHLNFQMYLNVHLVNDILLASKYSFIFASPLNHTNYNVNTVVSPIHYISPYSSFEYMPIMCYKSGEVISSDAIFHTTDYNTSELFESSWKQPECLLLTEPDKIRFCIDLEKTNKKLDIKSNKNAHLQTKLFLGQIIKYGYITHQNLAIPASGQIIQIEKSKITLRKAQWLVYLPKSYCYSKQPLIEKNTTLFILYYKKLQTEDIVQGIPKIEQFFEARETHKGQLFTNSVHNQVAKIMTLYWKKHSHLVAAKLSVVPIQQFIIYSIQQVYRSQGVTIADKHFEVIVKQMSMQAETYRPSVGNLLDFNSDPEHLPNPSSPTISDKQIKQENSLDRIVDLDDTILDGLLVGIKPKIIGITQKSLDSESFISAASFQQTTRMLATSALQGKLDFIRGLKENVISGNLLPIGTQILRNKSKSSVLRITLFSDKQRTASEQNFIKYVNHITISNCFTKNSFEFSRENLKIKKVKKHIDT